MTQKMCEILLVDDEPELRQCLADFLEEEGFGVEQVENGKVALEKLRDGFKPKLILLDYMMPIMDGKSFCKEFDIDQKLKGHFPIVLLSAAKVEDAIADSMHLSGQLAKPIDIPQFLQVVRKYCVTT